MEDGPLDSARASRQTLRMALAHASSGQVVDLRSLDGQAAETCALLKAGDMELMWLVLAAGKHVPWHAVSTSMTLQCIRGKVEVQLDNESKLLEADQVMYLAGGVPHGLRALADARLLMTVVLPASRTD